jgi:hypothetical protein
MHKNLDSSNKIEQGISFPKDANVNLIKIEKNRNHLWSQLFVHF